MNDVIAEFFAEEISCQEFYDSIYDFIADQNIRSGEYEANIFVIKKLDRLNFIIHKEFSHRKDGQREVYNAVSIFRKDLLKALNTHGMAQGFRVKGYGKESNDVITPF